MRMVIKYRHIMCLYCSAVLFIFFFFFSSRRRHTRSKRDWSSDVCSSDLSCNLSSSSKPVMSGRRKSITQQSNGSFESKSRDRSEERRVGKECRARWARDHEKKKEG